MAVGAITRDTGSPRIDGNLRILTGTIEVNSTLTAFALLSSRSTLIDCVLQGEDGETTGMVKLNQDVSAVSTPGTVAVSGNHRDVVTHRYRATFI
jgi:hypothetical protein